MKTSYGRKLLIALLLAAGGCFGGQRRIHPPEVDPQEAADAAIELYDMNGDAQLDQDELAQAPALLEKLAAYDQDGDGAISGEEIAKRIAARRKYKVGLQCVQCQVTLNGRPLKGAKVIFEPEAYLGDEIKAAQGTTGPGGNTPVAIPDEQLPEQQRGLQALHVGAYKVRITHPEMEIPAKYNTATELGYETESGNSYAKFDLRE